MAILFADRIINIAITGPLVRIELGILVPPKAEVQQPQLATSETLVMPLDGFAASLGMLDALTKKLIADGVLKRQADQDVPTNKHTTVKPQ